MASQADCDRIEIGMTRAQVEHVLGGPPGDYRTRHTFPPAISMYVFWDKWQGDGGLIFVDFDGDDRVSFKRHLDYIGPRQRSLMDRIMSR
jgi:hypothetical protein